MNEPTPKKPITVLLADDHPATRAGIRAILQETTDIQVIGEAETGFQVQEMVAELRPNILLLDLVMPGPTPAQLEKLKSLIKQSLLGARNIFQFGFSADTQAGTMFVGILRQRKELKQHEAESHRVLLDPGFNFRLPP